MSGVNKFIAVASLFAADSLFSQVYSCHYWLIGRLTVNRNVISFLHSPVLLYAVLAFLSVNRCDLYFFQCFLLVHSIFMADLSDSSDAMFLRTRIFASTPHVHTE